MSQAEAPRKRRVDEIGDESRRRILDAAETLFAERGFERTSMVDIAERSGISRGSIPWHFTNKDGLLLAVVERFLARATGRFHSGEQRDIAEVVEDVKRWMHVPTAPMMYTLLTEALLNQGEVRGQFVEYHRRARADLAARIRSASADVGDTEADVLASVVNGAFVGLMLQWTIDDTVDVDAGLDMIRRIIEGPPTRTRRAGRRLRAT
jgi:TetR/AcrR family transcriptional regulator, acrAB operon repressor